MEESKIQALHDTLSKLRRSAGLGVSSQYSWSAAPTKKDENGNVVREDGLPTNALYANFLREGSYDRNIATARKYGDGREIKRNFDDCTMEGNGKGSISDEEDSKAKSQQKAEKKERKKAEKKAAKLEAKRQAKLKEKRMLKREAKEAARKLSKAKSVSNDEVEKAHNASASDDKAIKTAKKTLRRQDSGSMEIKELAKAVAEKIGGEHDAGSVKKLIKKSNNFEMEGKVVRFVKEKKKRKREEKDEDSPEPPSSSPPPKKRRKRDKRALKS